MVVIRLARRGTNGRPFYDIVVADKRRARDGKFIEKIGYYNPIAKKKEIKLSVSHEQADYWIKRGAQPSERVKSLLNQSDKLTREQG